MSALDRRLSEAGYDSGYWSALQTVSVPAEATVQFQFFVLHSDGSITAESTQHTYNVPQTGWVQRPWPVRLRIAQFGPKILVGACAVPR